jgi:hypothetical protein
MTLELTERISINYKTMVDTNKCDFSEFDYSVNGVMSMNPLYDINKFTLVNKFGITLNSQEQMYNDWGIAPLEVRTLPTNKHIDWDKRVTLSCQTPYLSIITDNINDKKIFDEFNNSEDFGIAIAYYQEEPINNIITNQTLKDLVIKTKQKFDIDNCVSLTYYEYFNHPCHTSTNFWLNFDFWFLV